MVIDIPIGNYRWIEDWAKLPDSLSARENGRTHGVAVLRTGEIVVFRQADPSVLIFSSNGELQHSWGSYPGAHWLTVIEENGEEFLWLVDEVSTDVVKTSLDGDILMQLPKPSHSAYETGAYIPTWLAVAERRYGGNGDLWLADGYGSSLVHRFKKPGVTSER